MKALLINQRSIDHPTLITLPPNKCGQEFHYYPFAVNYIDVREVVILLMTYLIKYVFQVKQRI